MIDGTSSAAGADSGVAGVDSSASGAASVAGAASAGSSAFSGVSASKASFNMIARPGEGEGRTCVRVDTKLATANRKENLMPQPPARWEGTAASASL